MVHPAAMRIRRMVLLALAVVAVWGAAGAWQLWTAAGELMLARELSSSARQQGLDSDLAPATAKLRQAAEEFDAAAGRLAGPAVLPLRPLPVIGRNLAALRELTAAGGATARAGDVLMTAVQSLDNGVAALAPSGGSLPLEAYAELRAPLRRADALLARSVRHLDRANGVRVVARVAAARQELTAVVPPLAAGVHRASALLAVLPEFVGRDGPKRYLFVAQNPAEARGAGGFAGAYSIVTVNQGRIRFAPFGEIHELPSFPVSEVPAPSADYARRYNRYGGAGFWLNVNMTPDFPTAARAMLALYEKGRGDRLDGVIAADPFALQSLSRVGGPVDVPGFGRVEPDDVVDVVANKAYERFARPAQRKRLLGSVAINAFEGILGSAAREQPLAAARALAEAAGGGHLLLHAEDPTIQAGLLKSGVAGALLSPPGDFLAVIGNAGSAAKLDYYVKRSIDYVVRLDPDGSLRTATTVAIANNAPTEGVARRVIGPNARGLKAGEQRLIMSVYGPAGARLESFARSAGDRPLQVASELGHPVYTTIVEVPSGDVQTLTLRRTQERGWVTDSAGGRYRLTIQSQPTIIPTSVKVTVLVPGGMEAVSLPPGVTDTGRGRLVYEGDVSGTLRLDLRFATVG